MALAKTTKDHDEIRRWAEARGGKPAVVAATEGDDETGIIRLMFPNAPNHNDGALEEIGWDEWFEKFDESGLELTYQEKTAAGKTSDFNKLTYPDADSKAGKALLKKSAGNSAAKSPGTQSTAKPAAKKTPAKETAAKKTAAKTSATKTAAAKTSAAKTSAAKTAAAKTAAAKTAAAKTAAKKAPGKTASIKAASDRPARNYPKPEHQGPSGQVY